MFQQLLILGNVGQDPEMRYTTSGAPVTTISVATSKQWTNKAGERIEETIWFRVTCWNKLAEIVSQYVLKGTKVLVVGEMKAPSVYVNKAGEHVASLEVTANTVRMVTSRKDREEQQGPRAPHSGDGQEPGGMPTINEEDIPF